MMKFYQCLEGSLRILLASFRYSFLQINRLVVRAGATLHAAYIPITHLFCPLLRKEHRSVSERTGPSKNTFHVYLPYCYEVKVM